MDTQSSALDATHRANVGDALPSGPLAGRRSGSPKDRVRSGSPQPAGLRWCTFDAVRRRRLSHRQVAGPGRPPRATPVPLSPTALHRERIPAPGLGWTFLVSAWPPRCHRHDTAPYHRRIFPLVGPCARVERRRGGVRAVRGAVRRGNRPGPRASASPRTHESKAGPAHRARRPDQPGAGSAPMTGTTVRWPHRP